MKILHFISIWSTFLLASSWPFTAAFDRSEEAAAFVPTRLSYRDLQKVLEEDRDDNALIVRSLQLTLQKVGLFSITDIPLFGNEKPETFESLPACVNALLQRSKEFRGSAARHVFPDGTIRKTIATTGDQRSLLLVDAVTTPKQCAPLQQVSGAFRDTVAEVARTVGMVLLRLVNDNEASLGPLVWNQARDKSYNIAELVTTGEHLEHFHVYDKPTTNKDNQNAKSTLDWHTDQGLMLIFSPRRKIFSFN
jgi:hypothetical protein